MMQPSTGLEKFYRIGEINGVIFSLALADRTRNHRLDIRSVLALGVVGIS